MNKGNILSARKSAAVFEGAHTKIFEDEPPLILNNAPTQAAIT